MGVMHSSWQPVSIALCALILIYAWAVTRVGIIQRGVYFLLLVFYILIDELCEIINSMLLINLG